MKLLNDLAEVKNHRFATYLDFHQKKLKIEILPYNAYLLIIKNNSKNFAIIRLWTNVILNIGTEVFIKKEETKIIKANFKTKTQIILKTGASKDFKSCRIIIEAKFIMVIKKN